MIVNFRGVGMPRMADNVLSFTDETFRVGSLIKCDLNTKKVRNENVYLVIWFVSKIDKYVFKDRNSCVQGIFSL